MAFWFLLDDGIVDGTGSFSTAPDMFVMRRERDLKGQTEAVMMRGRGRGSE